MRSLLFILLLPFNIYANDYSECFNDSAKYYNVPVSLLKAIAQNESAMKPYALNISGKAYYPENKTEALTLINTYTKKSFDVGIMQINRWWFDRFGYSYDLGVDACWNIKMGAYILAYEISRHGYTWEAVGRYHSPTEQLGKVYVQRLTKILNNVERN